MNQKSKSTTKKILSILMNSFFYLIIVVLLLFSLANIKIKRENDIANLFGVGFLSVQSNSMFGENDDNFEQGDLIFVKMVEVDDVSDLEVGDVVTYYDLTINGFNTHRIVEIDYDLKQLITQADYNYVSNNTNTEPDSPISFSSVIAVYDGKIQNLGNALDYLQSPTGFAIFVILPVVIILVFEGVVLSRNILALNRSKMEEKFAKEKEDTQKLLEAEKEKLRQELLAEMQKEKNNQSE